MGGMNKYAKILWILLGFFCFRVVAQLSQLAFESSYLPPFDDWYSGSLAYPYLLLSQIIIIGIYTYICFRFSKGTVTPSIRVGAFFLVLGSVYISFILKEFYFSHLVVIR